MADTWTMLSGYTPSDYVDTMVFEVVSATKKIKPLSGQTLVAGEKNSQYVRFELDRFWDGIDISAKNFSITYSLAGKYYGTSEAVSAEVSTDRLRFGWIVPEEACCIAGTLMFVLVIKSDGYVLKTQIAETPVVKSLDEESVVPEPTREAWYKEFQARVQADLDASQAALTSAQDALTRANTANDAASEANLAAQDAIVVAKERYGSPLVANAGPEMVDTNRVYVFTGSESAYTYGHWYYYDNGVWNDGGVYNGNGVNTDKTLSIENMPADAKKTGDEISELKRGLTQKVSIEQGTAHAGEALIIGADGKVTTGEAGVSVDKTLTIEDKAADAKATGDAIKAVGESVTEYDDRIREITDVIYDYTEVPINQTRNNSRLEDTGLYSSNTSYKTVMFSVSEGQKLKVVSPFKWQFQSVNTTPVSGEVRVGDTTYGHGTFSVTVPAGATHVAVCVLKADTPSVAIVANKFEASIDRLLSDEEVNLFLEKEQDNIREINLNADFFKSGYSSRRTAFKVFNPTTKKGLHASNPSASVYDNIDIGFRTLYLVKGDKIITNIDAIYDNSKLHLPSQASFNQGYYGVILSTFQNNNNDDNGSVYFGREAFDGKWRVLDIEVTGYYELSFRQDVSYTNKAYILHQHKRIVDKADIVADITDSLQFHDGLITYNAVSGWGSNEETNIGTSGKYNSKTVMLPDLSDYVGKSVLISGLDMYSDSASIPAVVYYDKNDPTTPTTHHLTFLWYVYKENDFCAFPILDGYNMRLQFNSHACLPFVRVWVVDNDTLFKNSLANPVFYGKKILGFGDSYIAGQGVTLTWHYRIALENICEYVNKGYGGAGLCYGGNGSLLNHISDLDEDADIYFLCFGRNDNSTNIKIGENDDELDTSVPWDSGYLINTATFKGAMNYLFNLIETKHPYAKIILVTPWGFENNAGVTSGLSCLDYIEAMRLMATKWGITFFNAAGDAGIHVRIQEFRERYFLAYNDQSHLNNDGHALMCKRATKLLTNLLYDD